MKNKFLACFFLAAIIFFIQMESGAQTKIDSLLPVRGFSISVPTPAILDSFISFINLELAPRMVNTLILRVDYDYKYKLHPELVDSLALSEAEVKKIVSACKINITTLRTDGQSEI